jgi:hypothetical protein
VFAAYLPTIREQTIQDRRPMSVKDALRNCHGKAQEGEGVRVVGFA